MEYKMGIKESMIQLTPSPLVRLFSAPYVAGNSLIAAIEKADRLWQTQQLQTTLDLLGEGIKEREDITHEVDEYLRVIDAIGDKSYITISLKPTQMGLNIDPAFCRDNIARILKRAQTHNIQVTIDMEESDYTESTLVLHRSLREEFDNVGTVLQSRLFRTEEDIHKHLDGLKAHIRLCIGIYNEPANIALQKKPEIKDNLFKLLGILWEKGHFVGIATHDEALLRRCLALAKERNIPKEQYEVQMLLGVPRKAIQQEIVKSGIPVRLYVPYATTWDHALAYLRRRMAENPNMIFYVLGNLWQRMWRWIRPKKPSL
ncbi:MAG TPA: proline dehydrogenase [Myxococcales bacterium]|nr:proline dehydrogenase [Myxococcales bacterium]